MSDIVTLANTKVYLGIEANDTNFDAVLAILISAVSELIESYLDRTLIEATYTALELDGNGRSILDLPNWPVTTLTSVEEDDDLLVEGEDFESYLEEGYLKKLNGSLWLKGSKTVKVTYKAGYAIASMPKDLQFAAMMKIAREWKKQRGQQWGETGRSFPDGSTTSVNLDNNFLDGELKILERYRRINL